MFYEKALRKSEMEFFMNKKQEDYLLYKLAQSLSLNNPLKYEEIYHMITSEYEDLSDDEMTDKRFEFRLCSNEYYYFYIIDNETGKEYKYLIDDELLKLLNELAEENKELKKERKGFESCSHNWKILYDEAKNKVEELSKENKELKKELGEYK